MSTFSEAMALADRVIWATFASVTCTYTRAGMAGVSLSVVFDDGQDLVEAGAGSVSERVCVAHVIASDLPYDPTRGDTIGDGTRTWTVDRVLARDPDNLVITLELKRQ